MIYLGLDLGSKTLGLAISDRTSTIATSITTIRYNEYNDLFIELDKVVNERHVNAFVLGNPLNLDGSLSTRSIESLHFKDLLIERYNMDVIMQDERLSTVEANRMLISNDTKRKNRKKVVDKIAATIILQAYLDKRKSLNER